MSNNSTLTRHRPAFIALTATVLVCAIYYLHHIVQPAEPPLHRSNAVHRRRRGRASTQSGSLAPTEATRRNLDVADIRWMLDEQRRRESRVNLDEVPSINHSSDAAQPRIQFRSDVAPVRQYLQHVDRLERGSDSRAAYEEEFLHALLLARAPIRSLLTESTTPPEPLLEPFLPQLGTEAVYFSDRGAISRAITRFNERPLDDESETARFSRGLPIPHRIQNIVEANDVAGLSASVPDHHVTELLMVEAAADMDNAALQERTLGEAFGLHEPEDVLGGGVTTDGESEHSWREDEENEEGKREGQSLLNMLYHIAEDQSRRDGNIHRGVGCNSCGVTPIRGVRYRCSNCPDYDLCETCESMQIHYKTHLFYKIRVPAPFFDGTRRPQSPRYPGKPLQLPNHLNRELVKSMSKETGRELAEIEALWDQFKCLASTPWPSDPLHFEMAIDRTVFDSTFLPGPLKRRKPPSMPIHDRIFAFFDTNGDGLIGFQEFVMGIATIRTNDKDKKLRRTFDCYDMDGDGLVRRKDFLRLFWSYYTLTKEFTEEALLNIDEDIMDGDSLQETLLGSQPISATFTGSVNPSYHRVNGDRKTRDNYGDLVVSDGRGVLLEDNEHLGDEDDIVGDIAENLVFGSIFDTWRTQPIVPGKESEHPLATMTWPPSAVWREDVERIMGSGHPAAEVTNVSDRQQILNATAERHKKTRDSALEKRKERQQFYKHERALAVDPDFPQDPRNGSRMDEYDSDNDHQIRIAPPLEADAGQEYLYQILEESMNELLDPLFRFKEDLYVEAMRQSKQRAKLNGPSFSSFNTKEFRKLCDCEMKRFIAGLYKNVISGSWGSEIDVKNALKKFLERQQDVQQQEHSNSIRHLRKHGIIDEEGEAQRLRYALAQAETNSQGPSESDQSSSSIDGEEESHRSTTTGDLPNHASLEVNGTVAALPSQAQQLSDNQLRFVMRQVDERDAARAEVALGLGAELGMGVEEFDGPSDFLERQIAETPLDTLLAEAGFSIAEVPSQPEHPSSPSMPEERPDPTLPQHRLNTVSSILIETRASNSDVPDPVNEDIFVTSNTLHGLDEELHVTHVAPLDEIESPLICEKRTQWKYLIMLDCLAEEDKRRDGPGSLNYEEFEAVMKGPLGQHYNFLSMFYDMILY